MPTLLSIWAEESGFGLHGRLRGPFPVSSGHFFWCVAIVKADRTLPSTLAGTEHHSQSGFLPDESNVVLPLEDS